VTASERYLDELRRALPRRLRRSVGAEIRAHLADGIAAETANGMDRDEAERLTIDRLGPADRVAAQFAADAPRSHRLAALVVAVAVLAIAAVAAALAVTHTSHATHAPTTRAATPAPRPVAVRWIRAAQVQVAQVADGRIIVRQCYLRPRAAKCTFNR
jgi:hypothetical protein